LVEGREYRYVSPEWYWEWTRASDGRMFRNVLTGLALTNDPFFSELPPLTAMAENPRIIGAPMSGETPDPRAPTGVTTMAEQAQGEHRDSEFAPREQQQIPSSPAGGSGGPAAGVRAAGQPGPAGGSAPARPAGEGGQTGLSAPQAAGADANLAERVTAAEAQLAEQRQRNEAMAGELAASRRREERSGIVAQLRGMAHPSNPRATMSPALAERWADYLVDIDNRPAQAEGRDSEIAPTARMRMIDLIRATAGQWPELGERGFVAQEPAANLAGAPVEDRHAELDRLANERIKADNKLEYRAAVAAVVAERPELA
jgi:hypothetical protein